MSELDRIGKSHGTDKSSDFHDYLIKYEKYIPFKRDDKIKMLEIGVFAGASLRTWEEYFYNSEIVGIDIMPGCKASESGRVFVEIGSQTDEIFLNDVFEKHGPFDLILDDGSHINSDVIFSFEKLWNTLKSGGLYIIEDASTSYWEGYGGQYKSPNSTIEYFKNLIDNVNFMGVQSSFHIPHARKDEFLIEPYKQINPNALVDIESIIFINSIIIVTKK